ncbi:exported hypothetical protein [uncultured delta proteobacterium]|uniref:Uncharacterized protein n=1 Tax=uncultured delta proteobacterium TaxID=34034 RepID=A0A212KBT4_9DELT|nr:exported hypothetical protein [uncultured delta proteobacterium]
MMLRQRTGFASVMDQRVHSLRKSGTLPCLTTNWPPRRASAQESVSRVREISYGDRKVTNASTPPLDNVHHWAYFVI